MAIKEFAKVVAAVDGISVWPSCRKDREEEVYFVETTVVLDPRPGRIAVTLGLQRGEGVRYPTIEPLGFVLEASPKVETRREHRSVESLVSRIIALPDLHACAIRLSVESPEEPPATK